MTRCSAAHPAAGGRNARSGAIVTQKMIHSNQWNKSSKFLEWHVDFYKRIGVKKKCRVKCHCDWKTLCYISTVNKAPPKTCVASFAFGGCYSLKINHTAQKVVCFDQMSQEWIDVEPTACNATDFSAELHLTSQLSRKQIPNSQIQIQTGASWNSNKRTARCPCVVVTI